MNKPLPIIILIVVLLGGGIWYFTQKDTTVTARNPHTAGPVTPGTAPVAGGSDSTALGTQGAPDAAGEGGLEETENYKPASQVYKSADEAMAALKAGAVDYDDVVLEQFSELGDCAWCDQLYKNLVDAMRSPTSTDDERSYYAEALAISGKTENVKSLVDAIKTAESTDKADLYAEALELVVGNDDVVTYLNTQLETDNPQLKESLIAAVTNQGSRLAAETLYKQTIASGNADGWYSEGIGLGEFVPDEEVLPYLHELVLKRDQYSHLAVKAMLNQGLQGLQGVVDILTNSKDPEADRKMLNDALDHVSYEEDVEAYLKKVLETSKQPVVLEFAKKTLEDFKAEEGDTEEENA